MAFAAGTRLGPYAVTALVGVGGMGEVYKAIDTRLARTVAIKTLSSQIAADPELRQRFEREAKAISSLNHPRICTLHDIGCHDGVDFLVMEYLEGETLAQRLTQGALPLAQALRFAIEMADALEAAHERGIVHRDFKPGNVTLTAGGVKLLDFGIAKLVTAPGVGDVSQTLTAVRTGMTRGAVIGTLNYMSPEQARGAPVDERTDIWAFGCVLYEMLTGERAFAGPSAADTTIATLEREPNLEELPTATPAAVRHVIRRCLDKDANRRLHDICDARTELEDALVAIGRTVPKDQRPSIAVLPFANMSADKENEYFSDGLAEEIINALANMPGLKVAGRTSSFFFRGKDVELEEIGQRLHVDHILEGSVRRSGSRLRVTAQLITVADGFHRWSERYDREMTDIFALQDDVTHAIATALQVKLSPNTAPPRRHAPDLRAYDAYLKALDQWSRPTPESLMRAKEHLDRAIALDPEFAPAYTALGLYYSMQASLGNRPTREVIPLARAAVHEALRIDPSLSEPQALLGCWAGGYDDYDWHAAEQHWRFALAREPVSCHVRFWYGNHYLLPLGRFQEALDAMAKGLEGDPINLVYRHHFADGLRNAGRFEEAEVELRRILELDGNFPLAVGTLGALCAQQGKLDEALALSEKAYALTPLPLAAGQLSALLVRTGETSRAETLLEGLRPGTAWGAPTGMAMFHALCGELDQAAEWVERAIEDRYPLLVATFGPLLRSSRRWPGLASMMNLPG